MLLFLLTNYVLFCRFKLLCSLFELMLDIFEDWLKSKEHKLRIQCNQKPEIVRTSSLLLVQKHQRKNNKRMNLNGTSILGDVPSAPSKQYQANSPFCLQ